MSIYSLRSYQSKAVNALFKYLETKEGNPLIVAPTGSGKSHILAEICARLLVRKKKVVVLSHVEEIIKQDYEKLHDLKPCVYASGLGAREVGDLTLGMIQSVYKKPELFKTVDYILIDEAHMVPKTGTGRYRQFIQAFPNARLIGLTATPYRLGEGHLIEDHFFSEIVYNIDPLELVQQGYLCHLSTKATEVEMNTTKVPIIAGDFAKRELSLQFDTQRLTKKIIDEILRRGKDRKKWLIFAIDTQHAEHIWQVLMSYKILSAPVHYKSKEDRSKVINMFKAGHLRALITVDSLTTGFDVPDIDLVILMRPTCSPVLHVQMIGRGMRPAPSKKDCLVLDFAGNLKRLGPINDVQIFKKQKGPKKKQPPRMKSCPNCLELTELRRRICPSCGYEFPYKNLNLKPGEEAALKRKRYPTEVRIRSVTYMYHITKYNIPMLKAVYLTSIYKQIVEFIGFEHTGYPRERAERWWKDRGGQLPVPLSVKEALRRKDELKCPKYVTIIPNGKFSQIIKLRYG